MKKVKQAAPAVKAYPYPPAEAPNDSWNAAVVAGWYYCEGGDLDWLYVPKAEVPPGREINRAFLARCIEELKSQRITVDGVELVAFSWHETTMMLHGYRAMHRGGSLLPVNFAFGTLCDAIVTADLIVAERELAK